MIAPELQSADVKLHPGVIETLGVTGVKSVPQHVDVSHIGFMYEFGANGWSNPVQSAGQRNAVSIAGTTLSRQNFVSESGFSFASSPLITTSDQNCRVLCVQADLNFDAAGAAAFAGKTVASQWLYRDQATTIQSFIQLQEKVIAAGTLRYVYTLPYNEIPPVTWRGALLLSIQSVDGTNFPANTTVDYRVVALLKKRAAALPL